MSGRARRASVAAVLVACARVAVAGLSDAIDVTDGKNLSAHHVVTAGDVRTETVGDVVGGHDLRRPAQVLRGVGAAVSYRVAVERGKPITIEVEEENGRDHDVHGYVVYVDGVRRSLRTWRGCGAGPVHHFVQAPAVDADRVEVKLVSIGGAPVAVGRLWAFGDFDAYFSENHLSVPYHIAPTVPLTWRDRAEDLRRVRQIRESLGDHPHVEPAWTTWIGYAKWDPAKVDERIDYAIDLAREAMMPVQLCFDSWWSYTPRGPDGHGGTWADEKYQQVVWDETAKTMRLSVPNRWANVPWLTTSNADLNAFKALRIGAAARHLAARYRDLAAEGKQDLVLGVNLDNEPAYWASGSAGLGSHLLWADFNAAAVEAAKRNGVTLDPRDGLSADERHWLAANLLRYHETIAGAMVAGLNSVPVPGAEPLADNVYTQAMVSALFDEFPMVDPAWPGWESAAPRAARVGGEWNTDSLQERERVLHQLPLGRTANVNAECGEDAANCQGVAPGYALGQRFYTPYNYPLDKMDVATRDLRDTTRPYPAHVYRPTLLATDFRDDAWKQRVASYDNVATGLMGNTPVVTLHPSANDRPGSLRYVLPAPPGGFAGLHLELTGRANDFGRSNPAVRLRVLAAADDQSLQVIRIFSGKAHIDPADAVDLSAVARGAKRVTVQVELDAPHLPDDLLDWVSVSRVRFTAPWPEELAAHPEEAVETLETAREHNLLVSWRRDAELAIDRLAGASGSSSTLADARAAYARGDCATAYRLAAVTSARR